MKHSINHEKPRSHNRWIETKHGTQVTGSRHALKEKQSQILILKSAGVTGREKNAISRTYNDDRLK